MRQPTWIVEVPDGHGDWRRLQAITEPRDGWKTRAEAEAIARDADPKARVRWTEEVHLTDELGNRIAKPPA